MAEWDTAAICARIANGARLARGNYYRTHANLLPLVDQHLRTLVLPELLKVGEEYLAASLEIPLVAGQATYRLPWRSVRVLGLFLRNAQGKVLEDFSRATPAQAMRWHSTENAARGTPRLWHLEASSLTVYPVPSESGKETLVLRYARRPGRLVDSAGAAPRGNGVVTGITQAGTELQVGVSPVGAFGTEGLASVDFIRGTPGFEALADDVTAYVEAAGATLTLPGRTLSTFPVSVGDYVSTAGTAPVPQVPVDWLAVLESSVKEQLLRDGGDAAGAAAEQQARTMMIQQAGAALEPRSNEPEVCVPTDWL